MPRPKNSEPYFHPTLKEVWLKNLTSGCFVQTRHALCCLELPNTYFRYSAVGVLIETCMQSGLLEGEQWVSLSPKEALWGLERSEGLVDPYFIPARIVDIMTAYENPDELPNQRSVNKIALHRLSDYEYAKKRSFKKLAKYIEKEFN